MDEPAMLQHVRSPSNYLEFVMCAQVCIWHHTSYKHVQYCNNHGLLVCFGSIDKSMGRDEEVNKFYKSLLILYIYCIYLENIYHFSVASFRGFFSWWEFFQQRHPCPSPWHHPRQGWQWTRNSMVSWVPKNKGSKKLTVFFRKNLGKWFQISIYYTKQLGSRSCENMWEMWYTYNYIYIWVFPKIVVPPNHPF